MTPAPERDRMARIADLLRDLHGIDARGFGPLRQDDQPEGASADPIDGLRERWSGLHAWLVDGTDLARHPAWPDHRELLERVGEHAAAAIDDALAGPMVLVHSDLHEENVLEAEDGQLGFIDFGETFRGAAAWEFASIAYFLGWPIAESVLAAYRAGSSVDAWAAPVARLALSFGLSRWEQDRSMGVDEEAHDEAFLRASLARL
jgi:Ser/Thr protein kinase RdoA (MazF antagonist)